MDCKSIDWFSYDKNFNPKGYRTDNDIIYKNIKNTNHDSVLDIGLMQISLLAKYLRKKTNQQTHIRLIKLNVREKTPTIHKVVGVIIL